MSDFDLGNLVVRLSADSRAYDRTMRQVESSTLSFAQKMAALGRGLTLVTAPLDAFAALGVKAFAGLEHSITQASAMIEMAAPVTQRTRDQMTALARTVSRETGVSVENLGEAYVELAKHGMTAEGSMRSLGAVAAVMTAYHVDQRKAVELLENSERTLGHEETLRRIAQAQSLASKEAGTFVSQLGRLKAQVMDVAMDLGQALMPVLSGVLNLVSRGTAWWRALGEEQKRHVAIVAGVVAAVGPLLMIMSLLAPVLGAVGSVVGVVVGAVAPLLTVMGALLPVLEAVGAAIGIAAAFFASWVLPVLLVAGVIGGLVYAIVSFRNEIGLTDENLAAMAAWLRTVANVIEMTVLGAFNEWADDLRTLVELFKGPLSNAFNSWWNDLKTAGTVLESVLFSKFRGWVEDLKTAKALLGLVVPKASGSGVVGAGAGAGADQQRQRAAANLGGFGSFVKDAVGDPAALAKKALGAFGNIGDFLKTTAGDLLGKGAGIMEKLGIGGAAQSIAKILSDAGKSVKEAMASATSAPKTSAGAAAGYDERNGGGAPPSFGGSSLPNQFPVAAAGAFEQTSFRRMSVSRIGTGPESSKQQVRDEEGNKKLDTLIDYTKKVAENTGGGPRIR